MRLVQATIAAFLIIMTGCKSKTAFQYSEKLVSMERNLIPDVQMTESKVKEYFSKQQFDSAAEVSRRMEEKLEQRIQEIRESDPPNVAEAGNFKKGFLNYFTYLKSIYTAYKKYSMQTSEEERAKVASEMTALYNEKQEAVAEMQRIQMKYAKANGFKLEGH